MLSALVLILALFIQPIPDFVSSAIDTVEYLKLSVGRLVIIALSLFIMIRLPRIFRVLGLEYIWHYIQLHTPFVKEWILKRQLNQFFLIFAMMLESGLPFAQALPKAVASIPNVCLRKTFKVAISSVGTGRSVTDILLTVPVIEGEVLQVIASGEHSGKLAGSLLHFANLEAETISLQDDALAEWLVRFIYTAIALWMANSILHSSLMPTIPKNL
jgi:type II secretory pathway component PulF